MTISNVGLRLGVRISLLDSDLGGRKHPLMDGARPLVRVRRSEGEQQLIGLMEVRLAEPVAPGGTGEGVLEFHEHVAEVARAFLPVGAMCDICEGNRMVGAAEILDVA